MCAFVIQGRVNNSIYVLSFETPLAKYTTYVPTPILMYTNRFKYLPKSDESEYFKSTVHFATNLDPLKVLSLYLKCAFDP